MTLRSRRGSRWMSEARWSKAYCQSQSTTWMTPESLASSCLLLLPSSTSCSKLASAERLAHLGRVAHRARERVELGRVARDLDRVDDHQLDARLRVCASISGDPGDVERLAGGDRHVGEAEVERQRMAPLGVVDRHHVGDAADVDLERVDAQVGQLAAPGQPLGQRLGVEHLAVADARSGRRCRCAPADAGRCCRRRSGAPCGRRPRRSGLVLAQPGEQGAPGELAGEPTSAGSGRSAAQAERRRPRRRCSTALASASRPTAGAACRSRPDRSRRALRCVDFMRAAARVGRPAPAGRRSMRSHLRAGSCQRVSMFSARRASIVAARHRDMLHRDDDGVALARRLQASRPASAPKAAAMRATLRSKLASRPNRLTVITPPSASTARQSR